MRASNALVFESHSGPLFTNMEKPHVLQIGLGDGDSVGAREASRSLTRHEEDSESLVYQRIRRQVIQRGLARHRSDAATKESHHRARITRLERQLAIVEKFHRDKAKQELRRMKDTEPSSSQVVSSLPDKVVAPQQVFAFPRKLSLRQLPSTTPKTHPNNQQEENAKEPIPEVTSSPTASDIEKYAILASHQFSSKLPPSVDRFSARVRGSEQRSAPRERFAPSARAHLDKSTALVLCELKITKDIMMREHLVKQIHDTANILNQLGVDLHDLAQRKPRIDGSSGNVVSVAALRRQPSSTAAPSILVGSHTKQSQKSTGVPIASSPDVSRREGDISEWEAKHANLIHKAQQRIAQLHQLTRSFQSTTIQLIESILQWRMHKSNPSVVSNVNKIHRFAWKQLSIPNYLVHIDSDLRNLFPSTAMSILLGTNAKYNPLLLPRAMLDGLGIPDDTFVSTTFLTERRETRQSTSGEASEPPSPTRRQAFIALYSALKNGNVNSTLTVDLLELNADRVRLCLEAIQFEQEMERKAVEVLTAEQHRLANAYNPFESIKVAGGVEDAIASILQQQVEADTRDRAEQLRRRQEDTSRANKHQRLDDATNNDSAKSVPVHPLFVNPDRIRKLIEQRQEVREAATECELHDTTAAWKKNKLRGQFMVRKMNIRRMENMHARKIQRQFLVYRRRTQLLKNLAHFVVTTRQRVVSIQKVARGFIAKKRYQAAKHRNDQQRIRHAAAKIIWHAYKRFKRRMRHRHSMSVEAVAQIQLLHVIQHQLEDASDETSSAERYRRVGEERRRQRAVHLYKRRQELLEIEARRVAAATRIQSIYRMHLAKKTAVTLRGERRAHMSAVSAMMIQSKIRKFLKMQEKRRQRYRSDMERVNRCAVRIQSIYRGYNSRASLMDELSELAQISVPMYPTSSPVDEDFDEEEDEMSEDKQSDAAVEIKFEQRESSTVLPPIVKSRPSTASGNTDPPAPRQEPVDIQDQEDNPVGAAAESLHAMVARTAAASPLKLSLPPIRPRAQSVEHPTPDSHHRKAQPPPVRRQLSNGTTKVELKLKETTLGDDLDESSVAAASGGFMGPLRRRLSGSNGSFRRNSSDSSTTSSDAKGSFRGSIPFH